MCSNPSIIVPDSDYSSAKLILSCRDFPATLEFFNSTLGFLIETIFPADDPAVATVSGYGMTIRLERSDTDDNSTICLTTSADNKSVLEAPNGTTIILEPPGSSYHLPPIDNGFSLSRVRDGNVWVDGRAGMQYRDLIPDRQGGRFIASHIRIPQGGPVPDYVHYHQIRFQMIYCYRGWVKVVYEDQGEPFVMHAGDCVLQPPAIRHRVLESSDALEVVEIGCPAEHITCVDHSLELPTGKNIPDRQFNGQRFVHHDMSSAVWKSSTNKALEFRDLGIGAATNQLAGARVMRFRDSDSFSFNQQKSEFLFWFVLQGNLELVRNDQITKLSPGDAIVLPCADTGALRDLSQDSEFLEVSLPA